MKGKIADSITVRYGNWITTISRKEQPATTSEEAAMTPPHHHFDLPPKG